jgi:hypothetical protein
MKKPRVQKQMSDEAVKTKTGKTWSEWFGVLDRAGAKKWNHKEITAYLRDEQAVGRWWNQIVAVGYERARGLRAMNQKSSGDFAASGSRTLNAPIGDAYDAWADETTRAKWLGGAKMEISTATKDKSLRAAWDGGKSRFSVMFYEKAGGRCQVTIDHMKLTTAKDVAKMKTYWFAALNRLESHLDAKKQ